MKTYVYLVKNDRKKKLHSVNEETWKKLMTMPGQKNGLVLVEVHENQRVFQHPRPLPPPVLDKSKKPEASPEPAKKKGEQ